MGSKHSMAGFFIAGLTVASVLAQSPASRLKQELQAEYQLTTPTADNTGIVTMGAVLILQKKGFSAGAAGNKIPTQSIYQDGQIKPGATTSARKLGALSGLGAVPGFSGLAGLAGVAGTAASAAGPSRDFVNGERLYVTEITVDLNRDMIVFDLISDVYGEAGRYKGSLKFSFPRGFLASADLARVRPTIAQVFGVGSPDQNAGGPPNTPFAVQATRSGAPPQAAPVPDPVAPPPPPPPDPVETKAIEAGQTEDQVTAILGKPDKTSKSGSKEIYEYRDVTITFVNGKMTDAQ